MLLTPATVGTKVRTMGTNRARTMVLAPCVAKKVPALAPLAGLKNRLFGRSNTAGPSLLPIR